MNDQVVFSPGDVIKRIWVPLNPDDECEASETFNLNLSDVANAQLLLTGRRQQSGTMTFVCLPPVISYYKIIYADYFDLEAGWEEMPEFTQIGSF